MFYKFESLQLITNFLQLLPQQTRKRTKLYELQKFQKPSKIGPFGGGRSGMKAYKMTYPQIPTLKSAGK
ncbi:hypothetical protein DS742_17655 [Lacrimispora amygdalina]|uniref:Uncharacterized protein n=1 Tax=Lacrimispora amygdalina TaxID=253257 RepID=A0A3E2N9P7_9FIRM|nr:hypothetical protein DS742_17655 [Clostridium indicum]